MTRRGSRTTTTHVHRAPTTLTPTSATMPLYSDPEKERDFLLRRHQMLRRAAGFMLAKKYRTSWYAGPSAPHTESLFSKTLRMNAVPTRNGATGGKLRDKELSRPPTTSLGLLSTSITSGNSKSRGYTREELLNFWKDLPPMAKRALLRIRRDSYLSALDEYLVRQNLCCECHDNVIAEWEDLERRRSGSRSLQDVFSVFPPFLDDEDDDDDDDDDEDDDDDDEEDDEDDEEEDEDDEGDECEAEEGDLESDRCRHRHHGHNHHHHDGYDDDLLDGDDGLIDDDDEEVVFKYELEAEEFRRAAGALGNSSRDARDGGLLSDEYLAALEVGKRQEDELLRLIQKEERYIIIREDHSEFIMDLIRCGEQFSSYVAALRPAPSYDGFEDEDYDDAECPGANTAHLAQEYLLEVLAIKFREQLESAYQAALQHSLAVQAELLREEIAELQRDQKQQQQPATTSTKSKKKKDKKKKKKKTAETKASSSGGGNNQSTNGGRAKASSTQSTDNQTDSSTPETSPSKSEVAANRRGRSVSAPTTATKKARSNQVEESHGNNQEEDDEHYDEDDSDNDADFNDVEAVDREVEAFRLLLEKINSQHKQSKSKPKLVLPPGAFSMLT